MQTSHMHFKHCPITACLDWSKSTSRLLISKCNSPKYLLQAGVWTGKEQGLKCTVYKRDGVFLLLVSHLKKQRENICLILSYFSGIRRNKMLTLFQYIIKTSQIQMNNIYSFEFLKFKTFLTCCSPPAEQYTTLHEIVAYRLVTHFPVCFFKYVKKSSVFSILTKFVKREDSICTCILPWMETMLVNIFECKVLSHSHSVALLPLSALHWPMRWKHLFNINIGWPNLNQPV